MKRVLIVGSARESGGGVSSVLKLMEKMPVWREYGCYWLGTQIQRGYVWKLWYALKAYVTAMAIMWRYDIVHFHTVPDQSMTVQLPVFLIARLWRKKTILHIHCGNQLGMEMCTKNRIAHWCMGRADRIVLLAHAFEGLVSENWPEVSAPTAVVYNACEEVRAVPFEEHEKTVLFAGTFNRNKSADVLVKAFAKVHGEFPDWRLVLLGNGPMDVKSVVEETLPTPPLKGGRSAVEMPGYVWGERKEEYFRRAGIYAMCSQYEGMPMVVMEAWQYGVPVVTTPVGGLPDVIEEGKNCLTFPFGDSDALAEQLRRLMGDDALRREMGEYSQVFVREHFGMERVNEQLKQLYEGLVVGG